MKFLQYLSSSLFVVNTLNGIGRFVSLLLRLLQAIISACLCQANKQFNWEKIHMATFGQIEQRQLNTVSFISPPSLRTIQTTRVKEKLCLSNYSDTCDGADHVQFCFERHQPALLLIWTKSTWCSGMLTDCLWKVALECEKLVVAFFAYLWWAICRSVQTNRQTYRQLSR